MERKSFLSHQIRNFPVIYQKPELPTGCEITALTMLLRFYGYPVSKTVMAASFLPQTGYAVRIGENGKKYGPDLNACFVGNPFGKGTVCGSAALVAAANRYLLSCGSSLWAKNITGSLPMELYSRVDRNQPVVVMATIGMKDRRPAEGWYTAAGKYVDWSTNDHGVVLIGWSNAAVSIACPICGIRRYSRMQFEKAFEDRGRMAMVIE